MRGEHFQKSLSRSFEDLKKKNTQTEKLPKNHNVVVVGKKDQILGIAIKRISVPKDKLLLRHSLISFRSHFINVVPVLQSVDHYHTNSTF